MYSECVGLAVLHSLQAAKKQPDSIPFELRIFEVLLFESMTYLEDRSRRIKFVSKGVETDITLNVNHADIRRLLPLQTAVTALEYDVRGMKVAVSEVCPPGSASRNPQFSLSETQIILLNIRNFSIYTGTTGRTPPLGALQMRRSFLQPETEYRGTPPRGQPATDPASVM